MRRMSEKFWEDERTIDEISFAQDVQDLDERETRQARVREMLKAAGVTNATELVQCGCTGLAAAGVNFEAASFIRRHMAGSGIGLPCYVGMDRFCLVHNTVGGLQEGQQQRHAQYVGEISRELTEAETMTTRYIDRARRATNEAGGNDKGHAAGLLTGYAKDAAELAAAVAEDFETFPERRAQAEAAGDTELPTPPLPVEQIERMMHAARTLKALEQTPEATFRCPEHTETEWRCRLCAAQLVATGALDPQYLVLATPDGTPVDIGEAGQKSGDEMLATLQNLDDQQAAAVAVWVKAVRYTRKLTRE